LSFSYNTAYCLSVFFVFDYFFMKNDSKNSKNKAFLKSKPKKYYEN
jgi:hypothetical protein